VVLVEEGQHFYSDGVLCGLLCFGWELDVVLFVYAFVLAGVFEEGPCAEVVVN